MIQSKTFLWYKGFKDGRTSVDDVERSVQPSTSTTPENIAKVREAILADHRRTIHDAWNHGKNAGIAVYMPKGTTSKETVETRS
jgi:hypothetical protein